LTFDGDIDINSDLKVNGNLDVTGEGLFDGNVGINTDSPSSPTGKCLTVYDTSFPRINLKNSTTGDGATDGMEFYLSGANAFLNNREAGSIGFGTGNAIHMTLNTTGNLAFGSGKGIDFSATAGTGTSELLDDYEEGVFTPIYSTTGTDFTSVTYDSGTTEGSYTKIGNMVNVRISMRTSAVTIGSASGTVLISGLPFTASSNKNATGCYGSLFAGDNPRVGRAVGTTVYLYYRTAANTGDIPLAPADLGTGANNNDVIISLSYQTS
jgi:hypothetical protein